MKKFLLLSLLLFAAGSRADSGKLSTNDIVEAAMSCDDCFNYEVLGICFWLKCSLIECDVEESPRVGHYIPDFVIESYSAKGEWDEMRDVNPAVNGVIHQTESSRDQATALSFKNVDIISHPALPFYNALGDSEYFCQSMIDVPFVPYYLSAYDPAWNEPDIEQLFPQSILGWPVFKTGVGIPILADGYWAPLYPRCGWGANPRTAINAAVAAHRAAEFVTRVGQPHVYMPAVGNCENKCWAPDPVTVNETHDNRYQMLAPDTESSTRVFKGSVSWANGKTTVRESYAWALWRYYACCDKKGAYLGNVDIN